MLDRQALVADNRINEEGGRTKFLDAQEITRPLSRYNGIRMLLTDNNIPIQETLDPFDIPELEEDRFFEVTQEFAHRPDLISLKFYGTLQLYWVIAYANDMIDAFAETYTGRRLRIPDRENVFQTILTRANL
jgi:hypothetical protein